MMRVLLLPCHSRGIILFLGLLLAPTVNQQNSGTNVYCITKILHPVQNTTRMLLLKTSVHGQNLHNKSFVILLGYWHLLRDTHA